MRVGNAVFKNSQLRTQEGCTGNFVKKTEFWTFRSGADLIRVFWLGNELLLSSAVERKSLLNCTEQTQVLPGEGIRKLTKPLNTVFANANLQ